MAKRNIFAYTEEGASYPGYISLNESDGGEIKLTVRTAGNGGNEIAECVVPRDELHDLAMKLAGLFTGNS